MNPTFFEAPRPKSPGGLTPRASLIHILLIFQTCFNCKFIKFHMSCYRRIAGHINKKMNPTFVEAPRPMIRVRDFNWRLIQKQTKNKYIVGSTIYIYIYIYIYIFLFVLESTPSKSDSYFADFPDVFWLRIHSMPDDIQVTLRKNRWKPQWQMSSGI